MLPPWAIFTTSCLSTDHHMTATLHGFHQNAHSNTTSRSTQAAKFYSSRVDATSHPCLLSPMHNCLLLSDNSASDQHHGFAPVRACQTPLPLPTCIHFAITPCAPSCIVTDLSPSLQLLPNSLSRSMHEPINLAAPCSPSTAARSHFQHAALPLATPISGIMQRPTCTSARSYRSGNMNTDACLGDVTNRSRQSCSRGHQSIMEGWLSCSQESNSQKACNIYIIRHSKIGGVPFFCLRLAFNLLLHFMTLFSTLILLI